MLVVVLVVVRLDEGRMGWSTTVRQLGRISSWDFASRVAKYCCGSLVGKMRDEKHRHSVRLPGRGRSRATGAKGGQL